jgi:4-amino-4-deoxy-L-arabinose transferase-like glycosyltransferase
MRPSYAAALLALAYVAVLWATAAPMGFTRDESYYFKAAEQYSGWFGVLFSTRFFDAFGDAEIVRAFNYNTEHPVLVKLSQALTYHAFSAWVPLASPSMGFRISGFLFAGLSMFATFLLGKELVSARVGLVASVMLALLPRYFYDAHLACFDVAMTAMWTLSLFAFHRALATEGTLALRRAVVAGIVFGLTLATKLQGVFLPFIFVAMWIIAPARGRTLEVIDAPSGGLDVRLPPIPIALVACAILGPIVFFLHWPYLWHDPFTRVGAYLAFHMNHEHYPISYFGDLLVKPPFPWGFAAVMSFFTMPSPILALGTIGLLVSAARTVRERSSGDALLAIAAILPIALISIPSTPIFGGVKHWYNAMPALMILAARSLFDGADWLAAKRPALQRLAAPIGVALALGPGFVGIVRSHPDGIGFYNEIAGGFRGGAELGLQRGFWGGLALPLYPSLPSGRVFFSRTTYDAYRMYRRESTIPSTVSYANEPKHADSGLVFEQPEHAEREGELWSVMGTRPTAGVYRHNVTLIQLYEKGKSSRAP